MGATAGTLRKTAADGSGDEEEEEQQCRICRLPAEPERPLRHPCACRGSIRFVHDDCQLRWLSTSRQSRCEVTMVDMVLACASAFIPFTLGRIILLCTGEVDSFASTPSVLLVGYGSIFSLGATFAGLLHTTGGVFPRLARGFRAICRLPELAWDFCVYDHDKYVVDEPIVIGQSLEDVADGR